MSNHNLPLILEPDLLQQHLPDERILIVDLSTQKNYMQFHIPGAIFLEYPRIIKIERPVMGLLPDTQYLNELFTTLGMHQDTHVVAYDDEGGGKAARLLWTLDVMGHRNFSLLNGALHAWVNEGHPVDQQQVIPTPGNYQCQPDGRGIADKQYIIEHYRDPGVVVLDTRTPLEFNGSKKFSTRGGHIPGAVNMDWVHTMDSHHNLRLLPVEKLNEMLSPLGVTPDKEVILYCQSHHRSSHTYIVLKSLGYEKIKGYPGAWSEWGNDPDTPVETGTSP
jgi:thiosulfate/3-mercaptopyruvate sulfurtransferase